MNQNGRRDVLKIKKQKKILSIGYPSLFGTFLFRSQVRFHRTSWKRLERSVGGVSATLIALGHILVNHRNSGYGTNAVRNTKYHWWSFVFVNLFEQLM